MDDEKKTQSWTALLEQAVNEPGRLHKAYSTFHGYSIGNQMLALGQCYARELTPGPIAPYRKWQELGRQVKRGEKALEMWMPVTVKNRKADEDDETTGTRTVFLLKSRWFVLEQTEGETVPVFETPGWDRSKALAALEISETPFDLINGNCQGFARERTISVSPVAVLPHKTTFHEAAHVLLGHTSTANMRDDQEIATSDVEAAAEAVALICCEALGLEGAEYSRGYIQHWLGAGNPIPEASAKRVFAVADAILRAGR